MKKIMILFIILTSILSIASEIATIYISSIQSTGVLFFRLTPERVKLVLKSLAPKPKICGKLFLSEKFKPNEGFYIRAKMNGPCISIILSESGSGEFGIFRTYDMFMNLKWFVGSFIQPMIKTPFDKSLLLDEEMKGWKDIFMKAGEVTVGEKSFSLSVQKDTKYLMLSFGVGGLSQIVIDEIIVYTPLKASYKILYKR